GKRRRAGPGKDAAAVGEAGGAELGFTHELPAERKRHGVPAVGDEDEGARDTANVLLQEVAAAQCVAAVPARDAVAPARREGLGEPRTAANLATGSQPDVGRDESVLAHHGRYERRRPRPHQHAGRVAEEASTAREKADGIRVVLEAGDVGDRLARDSRGGAGDA